MSTPTQVLTAAYEACLNQAFQHCPLLIQNWCNKLVAALYDRSLVVADSSEKRYLRDAISVLKKSQSVIEQGFAIELTNAMADDSRPAAVKRADRASRSLSQLDFDDLELMGDNQVQETVDSARLLQVVSMACDAGLAGLSARMSTAQGFKVVKADKNPFRPEVVCQALLKLLAYFPQETEARSRWLMHGALPLGEELQSLYVLLGELLAAQGVGPAAYTVIPSTDEGDTVSTANAGQPDGNALLTLDHLQRLMAGAFDESFKSGQLPAGFGQAVQQEFSHTVPAAMDVLRDLTTKGLSPGAGRRPPPAPVLQLRAQLKTEAKSLGQALAIEVVGLMIEQMAQDRRLLAPVRELIASTEPAFLRLGVSDPRFFSDKNHAGRRLLEAMTSGSLAYASEQAAGFAEFLQDLKDVAVLLTREPGNDAEHFATLLRSFERRQAARSSGNIKGQDTAVQALLQAERRNLLAEKIAAEIRARPDFVGGNRVITAFLTGPWAQVMAGERLAAERAEPGSRKVEFCLLLGDILWSLDGAQAGSHRKRLLEIIPGLLDGIRRGLQSVDYPQASAADFFDQLMQTHQLSLKNGEPVMDQKTKALKAFEDAFDAREELQDKRTWLAPSEAQSSGFMDDSQVHTRPGFEDTEPEERDGVRSPAAGSHEPVGGADLHLGDWVELFSEDKWLRAQLTWISPHNTLYMFTSQGGRTHSMTTSLLRYLLLQDLLKVVSQQGVLQGALNTVARTAVRNSLDNSRK